MAKGAIHKCCVCEGLFEKEQIYVSNAKKKYCLDCGAEIKKFEAKEKQDNKDLNDYLYRKVLNEEDDLMPLCGRQIKQMKDENGWSSRAILFTLKYCYEKRDEPPEFDVSFGIKWLVETYYYQAKKYFSDIKSHNNATSNETIQEMLNLEPCVINMKRSEMNRRVEEQEQKLKDYLYGPELSFDMVSEEEIMAFEALKNKDKEDYNWESEDE